MLQFINQRSIEWMHMVNKDKKRSLLEAGKYLFVYLIVSYCCVYTGIVVALHLEKCGLKAGENSSLGVFFDIATLVLWISTNTVSIINAFLIIPITIGVIGFGIFQKS